MRRNTVEIQSLQMRIGKENDEVAFTALFRMFYASLYQFAMQYIHRNEVAEEIVNDVFVKLWKQRLALQEIQNLESYLFVAVKNSSLNYLKQYSYYHVSVNDENTAGLMSMHNPQKDLEWKELYFKLQQAVNQLPEQCRLVFKLVKEEGLRMKQVADILAISPRTVETQLYRAIKKLDANLNEHYNKKENRSNLTSLLFFMIGLAGIVS